MYDFETRRMATAIEHEMAAARADRLLRLGYEPAGINLNPLAPLRRLWSRRPHRAAVPSAPGAAMRDRAVS